MLVVLPLQADTLEDILKSGTLKVGVSLFEPWTMEAESGELYGFEVDVAKKIAKEIGLPILIKAAAGGGGKGMRIVTSIDKLEESINSAQSEALNSFKDKRICREK